jgi:hypothetical protein
LLVGVELSVNILILSSDLPNETWSNKLIFLIESNPFFYTNWLIEGPPVSTCVRALGLKEAL